MTNRRIEEIDATLKAIQPGWPFFMAELNTQIEREIERLIIQNNEETRGKIKVLRALLTLPDTLEAERTGILAAELPDEGSAP